MVASVNRSINQAGWIFVTASKEHFQITVMCLLVVVVVLERRSDRNLEARRMATVT